MIEFSLYQTNEHAIMLMDAILKPKTGKGNKEVHASIPVSCLMPLSSSNRLPFQVFSLSITKLGGE